MNATTILLEVINGYKTYSAAILTIVTGVGAILSKNYSQGAADMLQAVALVCGGASVVGLRHAVAKVPTGVLDGAGASVVGLRHAVANVPTGVLGEAMQNN